MSSEVEILKGYYLKGTLDYYGFAYRGVDHGEYITLFEDSTTDMHGFYFMDHPHGVFEEYDEKGILILHTFCIHGDEVRGFPFLGKKPRRLPMKSDRNRFQTLEI